MRKVVAREVVSLDGVVESPEAWVFSDSNDEMAKKQTLVDNRRPLSGTKEGAGV